MNISRTLFGWSSPHIQPLTPVSEVSEPPESPSPYVDIGLDVGEQVSVFSLVRSCFLFPLTWLIKPVYSNREIPGTQNFWFVFFGTGIFFTYTWISNFFRQESSCAIVQLQIQQGSAQEQVEEKDPLPPPVVPFVRLFAYADAYDWLLMTVGTMAAIVHGAALPVYLFFLGKIINLFALYQQDLNVDGQHHLSSGSYQNLADELSKALFLPQSFTYLWFR
jgi:hypothetical protein